MITALVRAAEVFVGAPRSSDAERARLSAEFARMIGALGARERRLLRAGVVLIDALALLRGARRFSRLPDATARRLLDALGDAPSALLRRLHLSVRMMAQLAWYADPAHWESCGYDGPWLGRVAATTGAPPDLGPIE